jgi:hypothetical protein
LASRDPKTAQGATAVGRPAFGIGPVSRVVSIPATSQAVTNPYFTGVARAQGLAAGTARTIGIAASRGIDPARTRAFGLPNLRRNVCPHFYVTGARGALPIQAPHLLKALVRQEAAVSRCQLRGGVHLEQGYVNDVCLSPRFNQCVFYEEGLSRP